MNISLLLDVSDVDLQNGMVTTKNQHYKRKIAFFASIVISKILTK